MRAAYFIALPLLASMGASAGCYSPVCDLARESTNAAVALTSPLADYDATVETTSDWFEKVRPVDPSTGEELDGIALAPVTRDPVVITLVCRDGFVVEEEGSGDAGDERPTTPCTDGFTFASGEEGVVPAEAQVRISLPDSDLAFRAPATGFTRLAYEPRDGSEHCPTTGFLATIIVDTLE